MRVLPIFLFLGILAAAAWAAFVRPSTGAPIRRNPLVDQEQAPSEELPAVAAPIAMASRPPGAPIPRASAATAAHLALGDSVDEVLEWADHPTGERLDAVARQYRGSTDARTRAIALYVLARSRRRVAHAERDAILEQEALPFLHTVALAPATDATSPAILALSAMGHPEAARILALASRDPREPQKAAEALSALIVRPDSHAVAALEDLARERASGAARLRAIRALLSAVSLWGPQAEDLDSRAALAEARRFLDMEAREITDSIGRTACVATIQEDARTLASEIDDFLHENHP